MVKVQVIKYPCCGKIFAASCEPECYTDKDWQKDLRVYVSKGCSVETVERGAWDFEECTCAVKWAKVQPNQNQLNLEFV